MKRRKNALLALLLSAGMVVGSAMPVMAEPASSGTGSTDTSDHAVMNGYVDPGIQIVDVPHETSDNLLGSAASDSHFDLRDEGFVTPVKNQDPYETCWTFATTASAESNILMNGYEENPDLSELQLGWYTYNRNADTQPEGCEEDTVALKPGITYGDAGGNPLLTMFSLMERRGLVSEGIAPYVGVNSPGYDDSVMAYESNSYVLQDTDIVTADDIEGAKELLVSKGALLTMVCYMDGTPRCNGLNYYQADNDALYNPDGTTANHAVTIVGWDDSYSRTNFPEGKQPENDGAWIVKNSWGNYGNHDGYFYLSYEDTTPSRMCASYQVIPASEASDNVRQYDGSLTLSPSPLFGPDGSMESNVFTAENDEVLSAVQFFSMASNTQYEVSVYTDVKDVPTSGTLVSSSVTDGTMQYTGYHTVSLTSPVSLRAGTKYAVVVRFLKMDGGEGQVMFFCEGLDSITVGEAHAEAGQGYICTDGETWEDMASNGSLFVKALTDDTVTKIVTEKPVSGNVGDRSGISFLATGLGTTSWSIKGEVPDGLTFDDKTGMLTGTYGKAGTYTFTVTAKNDSGSDEKTCTISVGVPRLQGDNRYMTMMAAVGEAFTEKCSTVVVASGADWPDALAASALAGSLDCPVILTRQDKLNDQAHDLIKELQPSQAIIVGGTDAMADKVREDIQKLGVTSENVIRIEGTDRVETAEKIETKVMENSTADTCIIASGNGYADALSISAYAYEKKTPILLTQEDGTLRESTLKTAGTFKNAIIVGGTDAVSGSIETQLAGAGVSAVRCGGADRYETSDKIISSLYGGSIPFLAIATGRNFPDALSGAAFAGKAGGAILLVDGSETSNLTDAEQQIIKKSDDVCVLGAAGAVSKEVKSQIDAVCLNR